jgi:hypothetical protein
MFSSKLQAALSRNREQLAVLQEQLQRLEAALRKADGLVTKWSKPMGLNVVVRFLKSDLDKEDIRDVSTQGASSQEGRDWAVVAREGRETEMELQICAARKGACRAT